MGGVDLTGIYRRCSFKVLCIEIHVSGRWTWAEEK